MTLNLLLPAAGQSSRYPDHDPKWLLTMPSGLMMIEDSVSLLDMSQFDRVVIVLLREHVDTFFSLDELVERLHKTIDDRVEVLLLDEATSCQAETVVKGIELAQLTGGIWIKDCDNRFAVNLKGAQNSVAKVNLHEMNMVEAKSKSYVTIDDSGLISNIVEKQIISNDFCCGGYGFESCAQFIEVANLLLQDSNNVFISHVILKMLLSDTEFFPITATNYVDWGTQKEYQDWQRSHQVLICNFEGCLVEASRQSKNNGQLNGIAANLKALAELSKNQNTYLMVLTEFDEGRRSLIEDFLLAHDVNIDQLIMNVPHSRQILLGSFSSDNVFPSAIAVNAKMNSVDLGAILKSSVRT